MSQIKINEALIHNLIDGAQRTFKNAEQLFAEAEILNSNRATTRAYFLHQISLEECGKLDMIIAAVVTLLMGESVDMSKLARSFTRHESKNKKNAYFLPKTPEEESAKVDDEIAVGRAAFNALQADFHAESNRKKNESLYGKFDVTDVTFASPADLISQADLEKIVRQNTEFLAMGFQKIQSVGGWARNLTKAAEMFGGLAKELRAVKENFGKGTIRDVEEIFENKINDLLGDAGGKQQ
jgi:AbiV family abortive infection protein